MPPRLISASACIPAPPQRVYAILADYREGHPRILPPQFGPLVVETGGVGEGTVIGCELRAMGTRRPFRMIVHEPEPGRVLTETDLANGTVTTFTVEPSGSGSQVTIATELAGRGVRGAIERRLAGWMLPPIYREELRRLAACLSAPSL